MAQGFVAGFYLDCFFWQWMQKLGLLVGYLRCHRWESWTKTGRSFYVWCLPHKAEYQEITGFSILMIAVERLFGYCLCSHCHFETAIQHRAPFHISRWPSQHRSSISSMCALATGTVGTVPVAWPSGGDGVHSVFTRSPNPSSWRSTSWILNPTQLNPDPSVRRPFPE
jgi:hypothetical protein